MLVVVEVRWRSCRLGAVAPTTTSLPRTAPKISLDADGRRPVHGGYERFQSDERWRDLIPFHEYFHGDTGAGLGASHQTGWTALVVDEIMTLHSKRPPRE